MITVGRAVLLAVLVEQLHAVVRPDAITQVISRIGSNPMTNSRSKAMSNLEALHVRAKALNLHGLLAHWGEAAAAGLACDADRLGGAGAHAPKP